MPNLKNLTVRYLRDLARKHLGRGHGRLKTKAELLAALRRFIPVPHEPSDETKRPPGRAEEVTPARATPRAQTPTGVSAKAAPAPAPFEAAPRPAEPALPPARPETPAEPVVEGFFVARVVGEDEARRHHLTDTPGHPPVEHASASRHVEKLPPLPDRYLDDRVVLLARDPHTAWLYWDLHPDTVRTAFEGLGDPRVVIRVLDAGQEVRRLDVALESRNFYVHGLDAGHTYRMELTAVGRDGTRRRIAGSSNAVTLPADDVSADRTVRFMRVPWDLPLKRLREAMRTGHVAIQTPAVPPEALAITHARWVPLPNSGSWQRITWTEAPLPGAPGAGGMPHLSMGEVPVGGSSGWAPAGSSWVTSPGQRSGRP